MPWTVCENCGKGMLLTPSMSGKYRFCPDCGAPMGAEAAPPPATPRAIEPEGHLKPAALESSPGAHGLGSSPEYPVPDQPASEEAPVAELVSSGPEQDRAAPFKLAPFRRLPPRRRRFGAMSASGLKLGPLDVGGVISNSFSILFKGRSSYAVIALLMAFPVNLAGGLLGVYIPKVYAAQQGASGKASVVAGMIMVSIFSYFATAFVTGCMTHAIAKNYLGESAGIVHSVLKSLSVLHVIFASTLLSGLMMYGGFAAMIPFVLQGRPESLGIAMFAGLAWVVPLMVLALVFYVQIPPIMLEGAGPVSALKRSNSIMKGIKGRTVLVVIIVWLLSAAIGCMIGTPFGVLMATSGNSLTVEVLSVVARALGQSAANLLGAAVVVVTYFDGRVRNEGFGLDSLADLFA